MLLFLLFVLAVFFALLFRRISCVPPSFCSVSSVFRLLLFNFSVVCLSFTLSPPPCLSVFVLFWCCSFFVDIWPSLPWVQTIVFPAHWGTPIPSFCAPPHNINPPHLSKPFMIVHAPPALCLHFYLVCMCDIRPCAHVIRLCAGEFVSVLGVYVCVLDFFFVSRDPKPHPKQVYDLFHVIFNFKYIYSVSD